MDVWWFNLLLYVCYLYFLIIGIDFFIDYFLLLPSLFVFFLTVGTWTFLLFQFIGVFVTLHISSTLGCRVQLASLGAICICFIVVSDLSNQGWSISLIYVVVVLVSYLQHSFYERFDTCCSSTIGTSWIFILDSWLRIGNLFLYGYSSFSAGWVI